jgi:U3 small nucleolar RNA-associated protein 16
MFAQLFGAAKRAISRSPSYQGRFSEAPPEIPEVTTSDPAPQDTADTPHTTVAMVTTRRGTETPGQASTPASSAKKIGKRELDALETPTPTQVKRQRKTTVEVKRTLRSTPRKDDAESTQEDDDEAEDDTAGGNTSPLAIRRRSSPKVLVEPSSPAKEDAPAEDGFHTPEPASSEAAFVTPFTSKKALAGSPTPKASQQADDTPAAAKKARGRPKKTQKEDANMPEEIPSSTQESSLASPAAASSAPANPKAHVRFGSEEPTANLKAHTRYEAPLPAAAASQEHDDDSASDSDEAPETISTSAAALKAASHAADASRAQAAQSEKELQKRTAREKRIAEEQAAKRARDALKAKKAAARAAKAARLSSVAEEAQSTFSEGGGDTAPAHTRAALPSFLPDALLADLDDVRPPTPPPEARGRTQEELRREKLNHHIKFLEQSSKAPKERRVGKHRVAVLGPQSGKMAAKVSRGTKGVRESWLKGRQGQVAKGKPRIGKTHRAKFGGGGFLRGED